MINILVSLARLENLQSERNDHCLIGQKNNQVCQSMATVNIFLGSLAYHTQYYFGIEERGLVLLA